MPDQPFHVWIHQRARAAGYDVDSPTGARTALAEAAGMSASQIGRTLAGDTMPAADSQVRLARALNITIGEMFVRSGLITAEEQAQVDGIGPILDTEAFADHYGVALEQRELFFDLVAGLAWGLKVDRERHGSATP